MSRFPAIMRSRLLVFFIAPLCALLLATGVHGAGDVPPFSLVVDQAGLLSVDEQASLTRALTKLETDTGAQLAVLTVDTTADEDIAPFANHVFNTWQLGRKGVDDGVLMVVARDDHRMRIEVGYGLEGAIPDLIAKRILDEYLAPAFRRGDYAAGIAAGVDALSALIRHEDLPAPTFTAPPLERWVASWAPDGEARYYTVLVNQGCILALMVLLYLAMRGHFRRARVVEKSVGKGSKKVIRRTVEKPSGAPRMVALIVCGAIGLFLAGLGFITGDGDGGNGLKLGADIVDVVPGAVARLLTHTLPAWTVVPLFFIAFIVAALLFLLLFAGFGMLLGRYAFMGITALIFGTVVGVIAGGSLTVGVIAAIVVAIGAHPRVGWIKPGSGGSGGSGSSRSGGSSSGSSSSSSSRGGGGSSGGGGASSSW